MEGTLAGCGYEQCRLDAPRLSGGYWILDANGTVFAFGDAVNLGSVPSGAAGGLDPATASFTTSDGAGYLVVTARGKVDDFGDAPSDGDMSGAALNGSIIAATGF
jgi:hypothetical protein